MSSSIPLLKNCPKCESDFVNSSLLEEDRNRLKLKCEKCHGNYSLENTVKQRKYLTTSYGEPSEIQPVQSIGEIREGDVMAWKRTHYEHHGIVVGINKEKKKVNMVEFAPKPFKKAGRIVRSEKDYQKDIANETVMLRKFMPLDCFPREEVVKRAEKIADEPSSQRKYDLTDYNCQHFSSECKTGKPISFEESKAKSFIKGLKIFGIVVVCIVSAVIIVVGGVVCYRFLK